MVQADEMRQGAKTYMDIRKPLFLLLVFLLMKGELARATDYYLFPSISPGQTQASEERKAAKKILERLAGVKIPMDHPLLDQMETQIQSGDIRQAIRTAMTHPMFLNITVKQMAASLSTRLANKKEDLNDLTADFIGVTRDDLDARVLLSGNFVYHGRAGIVLPNNDILQANFDTTRDYDNTWTTQSPAVASNDHYLLLQKNHVNLADALVRTDQQYLVGRFAGYGPLKIYPNPDPAGVLTSASFLAAHTGVGQNRRMVQYSMENFLCAPISEWADNTIPDDHITRDISRFPAGSNAIFQNTCRSCHGPMDGLRPAFGRIEHYDDQHLIQHTAATSVGHYGGSIDDPIAPGIVRKINESVVFPYGAVLVSSEWVNYLTGGRHDSYFGWRGPLSGSNMKEYGQMLANSKRFSRCMARRVFESICLRDPQSAEAKDLFNDVAERFEGSGYKLKKLFEDVIADSRCLK